MTTSRRGSALTWVAGVLLLCFTGFLIYHWYVYRRDHHVQNDELVKNAAKAKLAVVGSEKGKPGDWPQWRGTLRDGIYSEGDVMTTWPEGGLKKLWEKPIGQSYSSFAVASGRLFTLAKEGDQDAVICKDAETGEPKWSIPYAPHFTQNEGSGPRSTPAVDGDRVYAVGSSGELLCLKVEDGSNVWQKNLVKEYQAPIPKWGISFSPLIEGDLVITQPGAPNGASVVAFDKLSGKEKWRASDDPASYSSPIMTEVDGIRQVLVFSGNALLSLNPKTGEQYWRFPWDTKYSCNIATPIVRGKYVFISSGYGKGCATLAITVEDGKPKAQQVFYNWRMKNHFATSVYHEGHIYGFNEAYLTCMEMVGGKVNPEKAGERRWKTGAVDKGCLILADGHLIIWSESGNLWLVEATPEEFREKAHFEISPGKQRWVLPVIANGLLYIRDDSKLMCFDLRKKQ